MAPHLLLFASTYCLPTESDLELVRQFRRLNTGNRQVLREMLLSLLRVQRQK